MRKNWHWDIPISYKKIVQILARDDDPRFPQIAGALLSRVPDPKQVFALISPVAFCRHYRALEKEIVSDAWTKEKAALWKATFLRMSKELKSKGIKIRQSTPMKLDEFDRGLVERIRACRKKAFMTQRELGNFMGCGQQYISGIESGREKVSLYFLKKLAEISRERLEIVIEPGNQNQPQ